ncbi:hypothetical protein BJ085DRAFT_18157 [Dimargaris cristalligena]|uniref:UV radiation resistance protein and autophagy-related subunit 14-domain-containing protein n=1 Tax=Dimargaris cristalligena TaxID=215637 RepID=A0A4V1J4B3_9FUNG|nr:hypothetical protein BJ085DRAFT_18157 [Dimargaris cristalligena]|eukprot:RKP34959.1 hypothetical protein BJ085DRAFT_18157 [Dimargaris cristalligena]
MLASAEFPADYINACVGSVLHLLRVMENYLGVTLPFRFNLKGADTVIYPNWTHSNEREVPLYLTDYNLERFIIGLSMMSFDILYVCYIQAVDIPLDSITQSATNIRKACLNLVTEGPR